MRGGNINTAKKLRGKFDATDIDSVVAWLGVDRNSWRAGISVQTSDESYPSRPAVLLISLRALSRRA
jgi:hypothetical protein